MRVDRSPITNGLPPAAAGAMRWVRRRKPVLPLLHRSKEPAVKGGFRAASGSRTGLLAYAAEYPQANYGLPTGASSDLVVLDVDGAAGEASLRALKRAHGQLPKTVEVRTAKGRHIYFKLDGRAARSSVGRLGSGLDVRGDGSYVVVAGSLHPSGHRYAYAAGCGLDDFVAPASAPAWLISAVNQRSNSGPSPTASPSTYAARSQTKRGTAYAAAATAGELKRLRSALPGQRNNALNTASLKLGRLCGVGGLTEAVARSQLSEVGKAIGLEPAAIEKTIDSGLRAGLAQPRALPSYDAVPAKPSVQEPKSPPEDSLAAELSALGETEADNGHRFARRHREAVIYVPSRGFLVYDGQIWRPGGDTTAVILAEDTARAIANEACHFNDPGLQKRRQDWSKQSLSKGAMDRMVGLAKGHLEASEESFDAQPWLLCVANGTLDLQTGKLRPHDPADQLTRMTPVKFDPEARCPIFDSFLRDSLGGDRETILYLKKTVGLMLTGDVSAQVLTFLKGSGNSGKSTIANLLRDLLAGYACHTPVETFTTKKFDGNTADLARLASMRLVTAGEINHTQQFDEARVKGMTGGDPIACRRLYGHPFEYRPQFKLLLYANDFPKVRATDEAFWRRIRVLPFNITVSDKRIDPKLPEKLRAELSGILNWALAGCLLWQKEKLVPPKAVLEATAEWRHGADHVRRYLRERTMTVQGVRTPAKGLYVDFQAWCEGAGETAVCMAKLKARLVELGHRSKRKNNGHFWIGLRLRD